jgi:hypothetical protein
MGDGEKMEATGNQSSSKIEQVFPKEALVLIPLIGSTLAITYDVGYFYGIDISFFTFFSVTEHFIFAMEALPLAFSFAVVIMFLIGTEPARRLKQRSEKRDTNKWLGWLMLLFPLLGLAWIVISIVYYGRVGAISAVIAGTIMGYLYKTSQSRNVIFIGLGVVVLLLAWGTGFDFGHSVLREVNTSHSIQTGNQALAVNIIRSGDKGVLYYEPKEKQIGFLKWDQIQKISETRQ